MNYPTIINFSLEISPAIKGQMLKQYQFLIEQGMKKEDALKEVAEHMIRYGVISTTIEEPS